MADHPLAVAVTVSDDLRKAHAEFLTRTLPSLPKAAAVSGVLVRTLSPAAIELLPEGLRQNGLTNRTGDRVLRHSRSRSRRGWVSTRTSLGFCMPCMLSEATDTSCRRR